MKKVILGMILISTLTLAGCSQGDDKTSESSSAESSSSVQESTSESSAAARSAKVESSEESETDRIISLLTEANEIYSVELEKAHGFINSPETYTEQNHHAFQDRLSAAIEKKQEADELIGYDESILDTAEISALYDSFETKYSEMMDLMTRFPDYAE